MEPPVTSRQSYLTVKELAALLRIKERKVYDLATSGAVPCSRATGKLLFPEADVRAWIAAHQRQGEPPARPSSAAAKRPTVLLGSHDPLLEWAVRRSRAPLATLFGGSLDGLSRFRAGEGIAAGLHLYDPADGRWNIGAVEEAFAGQNVALISFARRRRGLLMRAGEKGAIRTVADCAGRRCVARQAEAGAQRLFVHCLSDAGLQPDDAEMTTTALSESDAALAVAEGEADVAFGLEALAEPFGLHFEPVTDERFDLLVDRAAYFDSALQSVLAFARGEELRQRAARIAGYDVGDVGTVVWNAP